MTKIGYISLENNEGCGENNIPNLSKSKCINVMYLCDVLSKIIFIMLPVIERN